MEKAWYNIITGHIYIWPMFYEPRHVHALNWVVFGFINVKILFMEDYIAAFRENVLYPIYFHEAKYMTRINISNTNF